MAYESKLNTLGVTFTPYDGSGSKHTYNSWGFYMGAPDYSTRSPKDIIVSVPYSNHTLNFSRIAGKRFYNNNDVTYTIYAPITPSSLTVEALYSIQRLFENYCWSFYGDIKDDYKAQGVLKNAYCTSFSCDVKLVEHIAIFTVKFTGEPYV